jgi:hypothetical protein
MLRALAIFCLAVSSIIVSLPSIAQPSEDTSQGLEDVDLSVSLSYHPTSDEFETVDLLILDLFEVAKNVEGNARTHPDSSLQTLESLQQLTDSRHGVDIFTPETFARQATRLRVFYEVSFTSTDTASIRNIQHRVTAVQIFAKAVGDLSGDTSVFYVSEREAWFKKMMTQLHPGLDVDGMHPMSYSDYLSLARVGTRANIDVYREGRWISDSLKEKTERLIQELLSSDVQWPDSSTLKNTHTQCVASLSHSPLSVRLHFKVPERSKNKLFVEDNPLYLIGALNRAEANDSPVQTTPNAPIVPYSNLRDEKNLSFRDAHWGEIQYVFSISDNGLHESIEYVTFYAAQVHSEQLDQPVLHLDTKIPWVSNFLGGRTYPTPLCTECTPKSYKEMLSFPSLAFDQQSEIVSINDDPTADNPGCERHLTDSIARLALSSR